MRQELAKRSTMLQLIGDLGQGGGKMWVRGEGYAGDR